jgi:diguanylate cyclase (GGDEF)-like protein
MEKMKYIQEKLIEDETKLKIAQSIAHLGHWELDVTLNKIELSEEISFIFGLGRCTQNLNFNDFLKYIHPDDRDNVLKKMNFPAANEECNFECQKCSECNFECQKCSECDFECEYRVILPTGDIKILQSKGKYLKAENGHITVLGTLQDETNEFLRINRILGFSQDITQQKALELKLAQQATTDFLTGCHNRRQLLEFIKSEFDRFSRYSDPVSILLLDLDWFKKINDTYGHATGDMVLIKLVEVCYKELRNTDIVGRYGGEEFLVILPKTDSTEAIKLAERLCKIISNTKMETSDTEFSFTASIGLAQLRKTDLNVNDFIKRADDALYQAKELGRNQVVNAET